MLKTTKFAHFRYFYFLADFDFSKSVLVHFSCYLRKVDLKTCIAVKVGILAVFWSF